MAARFIFFSVLVGFLFFCFFYRASSATVSAMAKQLYLTKPKCNGFAKQRLAPRGLYCIKQIIARIVRGNCRDKHQNWYFKIQMCKLVFAELVFLFNKCSHRGFVHREQFSTTRVSKIANKQRVITTHCGFKLSLKAHVRKRSFWSPSFSLNVFKRGFF